MRLIALSIFCSMAASGASAESAGNVVKSWDLLGKWGVNCEPGNVAYGAQPLSEGEISVEIESDGRVIFDTGRIFNIVTSATVDPEGNLIVQYHSARSDELRTLVLRKSTNMIRAIQPGDEDTPWLHRCSPRH